MTPVMFISHGAPTFALEPGSLGPQLTAIGSRFQEIAAVLVISAHWQTRGVRVGTSPSPETIHDFGGFAPALYQLRYPAPGHPKLAAEALRLLSAGGFSAVADAQRGLDHGAWVPLLHLFPDARIPVFQVSLPLDLDSTGAQRLGQALAPLRAQGVLIVGSGSVTHNLSDLRRPDAPFAAYAQDFARWVRDAVQRGDSDALHDWQRLAPHAQRAHPSLEHFLPLLVAQAATDASDPVTFLDGGSTFGVLAMDAYIWG